MSTIVKTAEWIWDNQKSVKAGLKRLKMWLTADGRGVLVVGAGGTGKSTFGHIFSAKSQGLFERLAQYEESLGVETVKFSGHGNLEVVILPGQSHRRTTVWPEFTEKLAAGKYRGILIFGSYGFHSLGEIAFRETQEFVPGMSPREFTAAYSESKRQQEVNVLDELAPFMQAAKKPLWILQVVTKEDLWWDKKKDVRDWYSTGPTAEILNRIKENVDLPDSARRKRSSHSSSET